MSSPPPVERFKGTSWEECQEFILAIRTRASWEGKQRDSAWMADFAANYFWHHALPWHSRLPEDVRLDWSKLEIALLDRWPIPEDDNQPQINPTPPAAVPPPPNTDEKSNHPLQGLLKIVLDGSHLNYYVKLGNGWIGSATRDPSEAIHVRCVSSSGGTLLERINHSPPSWLGVRWMSPTPTIGSGSTDDAYLTYVDKATLKPPLPNMLDPPWQRMTCTVLASGEVIPVWKMDETNRITLFVLATYDNTNLDLVTDLEAYSKEVSGIRAKLFIEPTD
ncbi:hypothetical protein M407DRAFT_32952 [Tulasnella calospora MUT 4182]|uniref:Uncharacterized protein n=1 Tax=Tulasnella calospora MUT 4182 TaxID=1051891 RepID=A0A0C3K7N7_9AGAM|nr:hypothetical protein M407DRAFT_32952 [Tulasnella calospora MUT 4182]